MKKKSFFTFLFIFASFVAIGFVLFYALKENYRNREIQNEIDSLKNEADRIKAENNNLAEKNQYFSTPEFQEKIAKEKLDLQKPDENVVIVKPSPSSAILSESNQNAISGQTDPQNVPNYKKWWDSFFAYKE
jgi:cell division protein FtsL